MKESGGTQPDGFAPSCTSNLFSKARDPGGVALHNLLRREGRLTSPLATCRLAGGRPPQVHVSRSLRTLLTKLGSVLVSVQGLRDLSHRRTFVPPLMVVGVGRQRYSRGVGPALAEEVCPSARGEAPEQSIPSWRSGASTNPPGF